MTSLLLVNPASGRGRGRKLAEQVACYLSEYGLQYEIQFTETREHAVNLASSAKAWERVIVAGGDGTINSVLGWLAGTDIPLGIIPVGTSNGLARELRLPMNLAQACRIAAGAGRRRIDLGSANGRLFILMAGIGFDATVVRELGTGLKNLLGPLAYVLTGLRVIIGYPSVDLRVCADDRELKLRAWVAVAANTPTYTYTLKIAPNAIMDDGLLDLIIFTDRYPWDRATQLIGAFMGKHLEHPQIFKLRARRFEIMTEHPVCVQVDGDQAAYTPVMLEVLPGACTLIVPEEKQH